MTKHGTIFLLLPLAFGLSACAEEASVTANTSPCRPVVVAHWFPKPFLPPGMATGGVDVPGRNVYGSGKLDLEKADTPACAHIENNKNTAPRIYDLQKIGNTPIPSVAQSASL